MSARQFLAVTIEKIDGFLLALLGIIATSVLGGMVFIDAWMKLQRSTKEHTEFDFDVADELVIVVLALAFGTCLFGLIYHRATRKIRRRGWEIATDLTARAAQLRGQYPPPRSEHPSIPDLFPASEIAVMLRRRLPAHKIATKLDGLEFPLEAIARALFDIDRTQEQVREGLLELGATAQTVDSVLELTISRLGREPTRGQPRGVMVQLQDTHLVELFGKHEIPLMDVANWLYRGGVAIETIGVILSQLRASPEQVDQVLAGVSQLLQYAPKEEGDPPN